jgi:Flp pilus assembly pilin Flp
MDVLLKVYARLSVLRKGQSITEYALILGAVAIAVYATYQTMGADIKVMIGNVNSSLATAGS